MSLKSYKDKQYLVFEFEDGKNVKYNLATGESIGKSGRPVKDVCTQLRGYELLEVIESFEDENYRNFLKFVDSQVNRKTGRHSHWYRGKRVEKIKNIGTFLKKIEDYSIFEQYFSCGLTNFSESLTYKVTDIPKGLLKLIRDEDLKITDKLIESYTKNPDLFSNIYHLEGLLSLTKKHLYDFAQCLRYLNGEEDDRYWLPRATTSFITLIERYNYNPIALIKYIDTLITLEALVGIDNILVEIEDYAKMMSGISPKYDKCPRNFLTTHKIATRNYIRLKQAFPEDIFRNRYCKDLEFEYEGFVVMYPKSTQDIKDEAVQQNHCVASYIQDVIDGKCHILFLREKEQPTKSLITMEVRGHKVVQAKGKFNRDTNEKENKVIEVYKKKLERMKKKND